jgi:hypothetical protein
VKLLIILILLAPFYQALAWDGVDFETNDPVEIGKGNYVSFGQEIEFYDFNTNKYHDAQVEDVNDIGEMTNVKIFDKTLNKQRVLIME